MSSSNQEQSSIPADELRDDELSKRFFYGGMLGLPWLWIVHAINFHGKQRSMEAQRMLREEQNVEAESDVTENERMWVMRGRKSAIIVSAVWVTWVVLVQFVFPNQLPSSFYVRDANSFEATGW